MAPHIQDRQHHHRLVVHFNWLKPCHTTESSFSPPAAEDNHSTQECPTPPPEFDNAVEIFAPLLPVGVDTLPTHPEPLAGNGPTQDTPD